MCLKTNLVTNKKSEHSSEGNSKRMKGFFKQRRVEFGFQDFILTLELVRQHLPHLSGGCHARPCSTP